MQMRAINFYLLSGLVFVFCSGFLLFNYEDIDSEGHNADRKNLQKPIIKTKTQHKSKRISMRELDPIIFKYCVKPHNLSALFIKAIIKTESDYQVLAQSHKGAMGLMQLMPKTARFLGVKTAFDPRENVYGGCLYISRLLKEFGDTYTALLAYNCGPTRIRNKRYIPVESRLYARRVLDTYNSYRNRYARTLTKVN